MIIPNNTVTHLHTFKLSLTCSQPAPWLCRELRVVPAALQPERGDGAEQGGAQGEDHRGQAHGRPRQPEQVLYGTILYALRDGMM